MKDLKDTLNEQLMNEAKAVDAGNITKGNVEIAAVDISGKRKKKHGVVLMEPDEVDIIAYDTLEELAEALQLDIDSYDKAFEEVENSNEYHVVNDHSNDRCLMKLW